MSKLIKAEKTDVLEIKKIVLSPALEGSEGEVFSPFLGFIEDGPQEEAVQVLKDSRKVEDHLDQGHESRRVQYVEDSQLDIVKAQARDIVESAKKEADRLRREAREVLEEARRTAEELESRAYAQGFEQGKKDGEDLGKKQFEALTRRMSSVIETLSEQGMTLFSKYEAQMVRLSLEVAKKVVEREITLRSDVILEIVRNASREIAGASSLIVYLNPKDLELIEEEVLNGMDLSHGHKVEFLPMESIERGGCLIKTDFGLVDSTMENKWKEVERSMMEILEKRTKESGGE